MEKRPPTEAACGDKMTDVPFKVGEPSQEALRLRISGLMVSVFTNRAGAVRYVVEADNPAFSGMLHIFNGDQLEHFNGISLTSLRQTRPLPKSNWATRGKNRTVPSIRKEHIANREQKWYRFPHAKFSSLALCPAGESPP